MKRSKIDYGIDLGTTNSAVSRIENGESVIKRTDTLKDTMPSCVYINKKKAIQVGDSAFNALKRDKLKAMKNWDTSQDNSFIEFKRTMGTNKKYMSSHMEKEFTSEELSAEVLKTLKSFIKDENVGSIVITVPAAFKTNQIDATRRAGQIAGFDQIEILQEPVAASMAYGLDSKKKDGFWLVFDFGGGTFDAALLKVEEGIMQVIDTEGDNYLGGKNLDNAIVDEIIIPYFQENFTIDSILADDNKRQILRNAVKFFAEEAKIKLSFNETYDLLSDLGDIPGEDDEGEEFELDITLTQQDMEKALGPVFQKAIDLSQDLLGRNNLTGASLDSLILVGGPTLSPVLRNMLEQQICKPDTSVDPMTVVSKGAALYASTVDISDEIKDKTRDRSKIQIEIGHESSTVETEELVTIKILENKTEGEIPEMVYAEVIRGDKAWSSGKVEINTIGNLVEVQLNEEKTNVFEVMLYDEKGNILESEPGSFTIIQGSKIGRATLPHHIGIEIKQIATGNLVFTSIQGLSKNQSLPATGTRNGLKTQHQIRPGMETDFIKIPIYQGDYYAEGTRAIYNDHVYDMIISGADLPALLPENSDVDLTLSIDRSQQIHVQAFFPYLDHTAELKVPTDTVQNAKTAWLANEIRKAKGSIEELKFGEEHVDEAALQAVEAELSQVEQAFEKNRNDVDNQQEVLGNLRKSLKKIDSIYESSEWPRLETSLKEEFYRLEKANKELGNEKTNEMVHHLRVQLEEVIRAKDVRLGNGLFEEIHTLFFQLTFIYQLIGFLRHHHENFGSYHWNDPNRARMLLNQGLQKIGEHPQADELHPIVVSLIDLLPIDERDNSVLLG